MKGYDRGTTPVWRRVLACVLMLCIGVSSISLVAMAEGEDASLGQSGDGPDRRPAVSHNDFMRADTGGGMPLGASWSISIQILDKTTEEEKPSFAPGTELKFEFDLTLGVDAREFDIRMLDQDVVFYVDKEVLPDGLYSFGNPKLWKEGLLLFDIPDEGFTHSGIEAIDGRDYYKYILPFNLSPEAVAAHQEVAPVRFQSRFYAKLTESTISNSDFKLIHVEDEDGGFIGEVETPPVVPEPGGNDDDLNTVTKKPAYIIRPDSNGVYGAIINDGGTAYVRENDLVVFRIDVKAKSDKGTILEKVTDTLGSGFAFLGGSETLDLKVKIGSVALSGSKTVRDLTNELFSFDYAWTQNRNVYTLDFSGLPDGGLVIGKGETKSFYLLAKVQAGGDYTNGISAKSRDFPEKDGPGVTLPADNDKKYDVALRLRTDTLYNKDGRAMTGAKSQGSILDKDGYFLNRIHLYNQEATPLKSVTVRIYIPAGLQMVETNPTITNMTTTNSGWTKIGPVSGTASMPWSALTAYERTYEEKDAIKGSNGSSSGFQVWGAMNFYLQVADGYAGTPTTNPEDFFVAAEVTAFTDLDGRSTVAGNPLGVITDEDSTPDNDPTNDLQTHDGSWTSMMAQLRGDATVKEKHNEIGQNGKSTTAVQDEDDFDFTYIQSFTDEPDPEEGPSSGLLNKTWLKDPEEAKRHFEQLVPQAVRTTTYKDYQPINSNGLISNKKTYIVYQIDINQDGYEKLHNNSEPGANPGVFTEHLPDEVSLIRFYDRKATRYAYRLHRYEGNPKVPTADGKSFIDYSPGRYSKVDLDFKASSGAPSPELWKTDAADYGLTSVYTEDAGGKNAKLTITFGKTTKAGSPYTLDDVAYRLYVVAVVNDTTIQNKPVINRAELDIYSRVDNEKVISEVEWTDDAASSFVNKYIQNPVDGQYVADEPVTILPDSGTALVNFRLEVPSIDALGANKLRLVDHGGKYFAGIEGGLDGIDIRPSAGDHAYMDKRLTATGFETWNKETLPAGRFVHDYYFTSRYEQVPYGVALRNTARKTVYGIVPLKLTLDKKDAADGESGKSLEGYTIKAYYADSSWNKRDPVYDYKGDPVEFNDNAAEFLIIPENFYPNHPGSWNILLEETQVPEGYKENPPATRLVINSDNQGTMTVEEAAVTDASRITMDADKGIASIVVYNHQKDATPLPVQLKKVDQNGEALPSPTDSPITFRISKLVNGQYQPHFVLTVNTTDGSTDTVTLLDGSYYLEELSVPKGYDGELPAYGYFEVSKQKDGSMTLALDVTQKHQNLSVAPAESDGYLFTAKNIWKEEATTEAATEVTTETTTEATTESATEATTESATEATTESATETTTEATTETMTEATTGATTEATTESPTTTEPPEPTVESREPTTERREPDTTPTTPTVSTDATDPTSPTTQTNSPPEVERRSRERNSPDVVFTPIGDLPIPLVDLPQMVEIFDDGIPLTALPQTGGGRTAARTGAFAAILALAAGALLIRHKKDD